MVRYEVLHNEILPVGERFSNFIEMINLELLGNEIVFSGTNDYINPKRIQYYKNLLYGLKKNNIERVVVMNNFDLSQVLQDL